MKRTFAKVSVVLMVIGGLMLPMSDIIRATGPVLHRPLEPGHGDYPVPAYAQRLAGHLDGVAPGCCAA